MVFPWPPFPARLTPFWVVMGEHCPRSCSSYSGQCRHLCRRGLRPFTLSDTYNLRQHGSCRPRSRALTRGAAFMLGVLWSRCLLCLRVFASMALVARGAGLLLRAQPSCSCIMVTLYVTFESFPQKGGGPPAVTCTARRPAGLAAVAASP